MKNFNQNSAADSGAKARQMCFVCEKPIADGGWFCRLPQKTDGATGRQAEISLCSPVCALRHFGDSQPSGNGFEPGYDGFETLAQVSGGGQTQNATRAARVPKAAEENKG